jgi:hypothetical protein
MKTDYRIISVDTENCDFYWEAVSALAEKVNAVLEEGWKLQGGVATGIHSATDQLFLMQAVCRGVE